MNDDPAERAREQAGAGTTTTPLAGAGVLMLDVGPGSATRQISRTV